MGGYFFMVYDHTKIKEDMHCMAQECSDKRPWYQGCLSEVVVALDLEAVFFGVGTLIFCVSTLELAY